MDCPICLASDTRAIYGQVPDFEHGGGTTAKFRACTTCGALYQYPPPKSDALRSIYTPTYRSLQQRGLFSFLKDIVATLQAQRIRRYIPGLHDKVLELGCGGGHLLRALRRAGYDGLSGVDWAIAPGTSDLDGVKLIAHDIATYTPDKSLDLIILNNVLEHLPDPGAILSRYRRCLRPGGRLIVVTPNADSLSRRIFGRFWAGLHSPWHVFVFSPRALTILAQRAGCRIRSGSTAAELGSWALSIQALWRSLRPAANRAGGSGFGLLTLAVLPFCVPFAYAEQLFGKGSSAFALLEPVEKHLEQGKTSINPR